MSLAIANGVYSAEGEKISFQHPVKPSEMLHEWLDAIDYRLHSALSSQFSSAMDLLKPMLAPDMDEFREKVPSVLDSVCNQVAALALRVHLTSSVESTLASTDVNGRLKTLLDSQMQLFSVRRMWMYVWQWLWGGCGVYSSTKVLYRSV